ncbi:MAG: hypothetical protein FJ280_20170 [Planctomycetes bacterium]|nr:hypothetical protein [Planctomycetota bacterium]
MPVLQWALTCNRVVTDTETNSVSYIDALEAFAVSSFPIPFPPICVSTLWRREREEDTLHARVRIQDPAGQTILSVEPDSPIPLTKKRHRLNVILGGPEIHGPGEYLIIVEQRAGKTAKVWKQEHVLPIDVTHFTPVQQQKRKPKEEKRRPDATKALRQRHTAVAASRRR